MEDKVKFGYFDKKDCFNISFVEFDRNFLEKNNRKFVQLYVNTEPFLVAGNDMYHRDILRLYLEKFNLEFKTRLNESGDEVPLEKGNNYKLVGAGLIALEDNNLVFYNHSGDYNKGSNRKHLEGMFGKENITNKRRRLGLGTNGIETLFFVKI
jgi:hypothetical protein